MRLSTLFGFLIGRRQAILDVAGDRWALLYGFLFVLAAGHVFSGARAHNTARSFFGPQWGYAPRNASTASRSSTKAWTSKTRGWMRP